MRYTILVLFLSLTMNLIGANLIHEFTFDGTLADNFGNSTLEPIHVASSIFDQGVWNWTATSNPGAGLLLPANLPNNECYTIQIHFKYNSLNPGWTKILNFNNIQQIPWGDFSNDTGVYFNGADIAFYNQMFFYGNTFEVNTWYDLIISRGTDSYVSVFIAELGQEPQMVMLFQDTFGIGIPSKLLDSPDAPSYFGLFYDDIRNGTEWTSGGAVSMVKIWDNTINPLVIDTINVEILEGSTHLSWNPVQGATMYNVYYNNTLDASTWIHLAYTTEPDYIHPAMEAAKFFRVTAVLP